MKVIVFSLNYYISCGAPFLNTFDKRNKVKFKLACGKQIAQGGLINAKVPLLNEVGPTANHRAIGVHPICNGDVIKECDTMCVVRVKEGSGVYL